jgi:hypothetical protein
MLRPFKRTTQWHHTSDVGVRIHLLRTFSDAQVSPGHPNFVLPHPATILRLDCLDAMKNAFHREAVSVVLPYVQTMDNVSWWLSQKIQFHLTAGCFSGYVAILGGYGESHSQQHTAYPRGFNDPLVRETLYNVLHPVGLVPWPIDVGRMLGQGNCTRLPGAPELALERVFSSGDWMVGEAFLKCKAALKTRFSTSIGTSDLRDSPMTPGEYRKKSF